jgi:hypothetical protein
MRVHTVVGKVSSEGLRKMDEVINAWLERESVQPTLVTQTFGSEVHHDVTANEPVVITSIWYNEPS